MGGLNPAAAEPVAIQATGSRPSPRTLSLFVLLVLVAGSGCLVLSLITQIDGHVVRVRGLRRELRDLPEDLPIVV